MLTTEEKREQIEKLTYELLKDSYEAMIKNIDRALRSGAIDIDSFDENSRMLIPKSIVTAILQNESTKYDGGGTSFEKKVRKEARNIKYYL